MEIAMIASDKKKELMVQFCIAYCGVLSRHNLCATDITGKFITDATGLSVERLLTGKGGGNQQISSKISYNEIDAVLFFRDTAQDNLYNESELNILRLCDIHNIPIATNIATGELLIRAIDNGDLDWRDYVNAKSTSVSRKNPMK